MPADLDIPRLCGCGAAITKGPGPGRWPRRCATCRAPARHTERQCHCGKLFTGLANKKYCSRPCGSRAAHLKAVADGRAAARYAAARSDGRYEAWAAAQSQKRAVAKALQKCRYCDNSMTLGRRVHCGSPECARLHNNARAREYQRAQRAAFRARGESYRGQWRSPEQRAALDELTANPDKQRQRKQEGWQRRRARKRQLPVESFRHVDVFDRDEWICQLCDRSVDPALRYPDPLSASLDHRKPLALGGSHTQANTQLAHLACNVSRGTKPPVGEVVDGIATRPEELGASR